MKKLFLLRVLAMLAFPVPALAQVDQKEVTRILGTLAADSMMGRASATMYAVKAANFIAAEFGKAGLKPLPGEGRFDQQFRMILSKTDRPEVVVDGKAIPPEDVMVFAVEPLLDWKQGSATQTWMGKGEPFGQKVFGMVSEKGGNRVVFADTMYRRMLARLRRFPFQRFAGNGNLVIILTPQQPTNWTLSCSNRLEDIIYRNVAGMIPGKRADEYVIFSSHYDHLGAGPTESGAPPTATDSIYNGANDDASGTAAVITLAQHFSKQPQPERTLLFVAFTAEEVGGYGSTYFSQQLAPEKVMAMFNIEMIGTDSKWGRNSAYITGFEKTDFGTILQESLKGTPFNFYPDPYPKQNLFYRSDNATLARQGVPAHTISTSKMDSEPYYHTVDDEIETLDLANMTEIIKAIALSSKSIIDGSKTPTRVKN